MLDIFCTLWRIKHYFEVTCFCEHDDIFIQIQVKGVIADCIDKQTVQLYAGKLLLKQQTLESQLRYNSSTFKLCFARPSSQNCTINVSLVDGNGNIMDFSNVDCRKLFVPAKILMR